MNSSTICVLYFLMQNILTFLLIVSNCFPQDIAMFKECYFQGNNSNMIMYYVFQVNILCGMKIRLRSCWTSHPLNYSMSPFPLNPGGNGYGWLIWAHMHHVQYYSWPFSLVMYSHTLFSQGPSCCNFLFTVMMLIADYIYPYQAFQGFLATDNNLISYPLSYIIVFQLSLSVKAFCIKSWSINYDCEWLGQRECKWTVKTAIQFPFYCTNSFLVSLVWLLFMVSQLFPDFFPGLSTFHNCLQ